ncbi:ATP-binding protein [Beggiatoa leptomitoformis]|uniref:Novel STAND NTPase 1 domain-containing protein n=1 Tax=Beggiatoa leptomitoformis TaxID=288004 RepID=A0A2N9YCG8_9GAMM|nr:ATP-binding protein [Beggiatoa leptomitoformis]ALG66544.1 hypothetical protein AL038_00825 [Beggiatoa leptomitoformis]AUI68157.1 hypothetical protein BLE401_05220 [Beggiatoa leptomitoformis]
MCNTAYIQTTYLAQDTLRLNGRYGQVTIFQQYSSLADRKTQSHKEINPFRGLSAFHAQHTAQFFGRETLLDKLWERLLSFYGEQANPLTLRLLPIIGPSGVGKSSLVQAGLLPQWVNQRYAPFRRLWLAVIKPSAHPLKSLAFGLSQLHQRITNDNLDKTLIFTQQLQHKLGLSKLLQTFPESTNAPVFLLIEQFEELYTHCQDDAERELFIDNLLFAASDAKTAFTLILTLRTDFLATTQHHPLLYQALATQSILVPMLTKSQLRQAICAPSSDSNYPLAETTIEQFIQQTRSNAESLPLLQFTLQRLWHYKQQGMSETQALKMLNDVPQALSIEAERLYHALSSREKSTARAIFLKLLHIDEQGAHPRRVTQETLINTVDTAETVEAVLNSFSQTETRLLTISKSHGQTFVELTHAVLLTHWSRLARWITALQRDAFFQHRLADAAKQWDREKRSSRLLWRATDLALLRQYYARSGEDLSTIQYAFFVESDRQQRIFQRLKRWFFSGLVLLSTAGLLGVYEKGKTIEEVEYQLNIAWENVELAQAERDKAIIAEQKAKALHNYVFFPDNIYASPAPLQLADNTPVVDATTDRWLSDAQLQEKLQPIHSVALELPSPPASSVEKEFSPYTMPIVIIESGQKIDPIKAMSAEKPYIIVHAEPAKPIKPARQKPRVVASKENNRNTEHDVEDDGLFGTPVHYTEYKAVATTNKPKESTTTQQKNPRPVAKTRPPIKPATIASTSDTESMQDKPHLAPPKTREGFLF